jgi:methionine aminopeptidase
MTEIALVRESSLLVGRTLAEVATPHRAGVTTRELDRVAEEFIRDHGAEPVFKGFKVSRHALHQRERPRGARYTER